MAIRRQNTNPVIVLDCVVVDVKRDSYTNPDTGEVQDRGRKLTVQTGVPTSDMLEVKVPVGHDEVVVVPGEHLLLNVEYLEWEMDGRRGSTMRFHSFVTHQQLDSWGSLLQTTAAATA